MYCKKCGGYNMDDRQTCMTCGHSLSEPAEPITKPVPTPPPYLSDDDIDVLPFLKESIARPLQSIQKSETESILTPGSFAGPPSAKPAAKAAAPKPARADIRGKTDESKTYLLPAILVAIFCSGVFGVAALILSSMTKAAYAAGDSHRAGEYSQRTKLFCWIGLVAGIVTAIAVTLIYANFMSIRANIHVTFPDL